VLDFSARLQARCGLPLLLAVGPCTVASQSVTARALATTLLTRLGARDAPWHDGRHGLPEPPPGLRVALAHTRGLAAAVAALHHDVRAVGVDVELRDRARELTPATWRHLLHPHECVSVRALPHVRRPAFALRRLLAKEAAGKAWATWSTLPPPPPTVQVTACGPWVFVGHCPGLPEVRGVWLQHGAWLLAVAWVPVSVYSSPST